MLTRRTLAVLVVALLAASCGGNEKPESQGNPSSEELVVQAANYDLVAGEPSRFIAGVLTQDQLFVSYGDVDMEFFYLGTKQGSGTAQQGPTATGHFLAIEGDPNSSGPIAAPASSGRGVYAAQVKFDKAGYWAVELTAELEGSEMSGRSVFQVYDKHQYPAPGDRALRTENRTLTSDVPERAIDSRAETSGKIPDPDLHKMMIADSIAKHEPAVVVFSTPVYCVSRFCGPVTDTIEALAHKYSDRANFIHVEIWFNFQKRQINEAAADWLLVGGDATEPWVYLIGADGRIADRWDNVVTRGEVEAELKKLPPM